MEKVIKFKVFNFCSVGLHNAQGHLKAFTDRVNKFIEEVEVIDVSCDRNADNVSNFWEADLHLTIFYTVSIMRIKKAYLK